MQTVNEQNEIIESPKAPSPTLGVSLEVNPETPSGVCVSNEVNPETPSGVCVSNEVKSSTPTQDISKVLSSILSEIVSQRDTLNSQGKMLKSLKEDESEGEEDESEGEEDESEGEEDESEEEILDMRWKTINKLLDSHLEITKAVNQLISEE